MKKALIALLVAALVLTSFVSCGGEKGVAHVKSFEEFQKAFAEKDAKGYTSIVLDNDIDWDIKNFPGGDGAVFSADATGLVIDLCGHTIKNVGTNAFNLTGNSFTVKNGKITAYVTNSKYAMNINYEGSNASPSNGFKEKALAAKPVKYDDSDPVWAKRIIVEDLVCTGSLMGYSTVELKNCDFSGGTYRGLVLQGSSGTVENVKAWTVEESPSSAGFVIHSYGTVTVKSGSYLDAKGKFGIYAACGGEFLMEDGATVTAAAFNTYAVYAEKQGHATFKSGATLSSAGTNAALYIRTGSGITLEKGVVVNIPSANASLSNDDGSVGSFDADWVGGGLATVVTDNR